MKSSYSSRNQEQTLPTMLQLHNLTCTTVLFFYSHVFYKDADDKTRLYTTSNTPNTLQKRTVLLQYFSSYMDENLIQVIFLICHIFTGSVSTLLHFASLLSRTFGGLFLRLPTWTFLFIHNMVLWYIYEYMMIIRLRALKYRRGIKFFERHLMWNIMAFIFFTQCVCD